jgi:hypothetical protein
VVQAQQNNSNESLGGRDLEIQAKAIPLVDRHMAITLRGRSKLWRGTMRNASFVLLALSFVISCKKPKPDFAYTVKALDGSRLAIIRGFQPRGTIEGYILISFEKANHESPAASFLQIKNGNLGWISNDTFVVVADQMRFQSLSSEYYPDGTTDSEVNLVVCSRNHMDCSSLLDRLHQAAKMREIPHFPEN